MRPLVISHFATANPLGLGSAATLRGLVERRGALRRMDFHATPLETWIGRVEGLEEQPVAGRLAEFDCRNNRLAQAGLRQDGFEEAVARARSRYGANRIAVILGTSTSGIEHCERAYRERDANTGSLPPWFRERHTLNLFSVADFVQKYLGLQGPAATISTACSSSAKVFASAARMIEAGFADAAVVGGVDSLCLTTLYGFGSLELLSREPCRPCDAGRDGISIGEAAGFALLERPEPGSRGVALVGYGESSDAYHMSSPDPEGEGAYIAMRSALEGAGIEPADVGYLNMHGTGTPANDCIEDRAIYRLFRESVLCSSTKGWTGHTLGAAGITEAIICALCLSAGLVPGSLNLDRIDPTFSSHVAVAAESRDLRYVMSNSFGFGGSNCSLVFGQLA
ncbi:MAG: beta-ketoacyl-[acyl-carrier-protein] synthase family protein [Burkholderiales bacterium]